MGARYEFKHFKYSSHYWILKFISEKRPPLRILDVGTAEGYLGAILNQQGHSVHGVERDPVMSEKARSYYDSFYVSDLERFSFPYQQEFDYILLADVLEHVREPAAVLERSLSCLKPKGEVIVSVPNVAHIFVRLSLLFGRFDYADRGILDRTHLRFFTLRSARKMIEEASCRILEGAVTPLPLQLVFPSTDRQICAPLHEINYLIAALWKTSFAYQFVLRATKRAWPGA